MKMTMIIFRVAGATGTIVTFPFDYVKTQFQVSGCMEKLLVRITELGTYTIIGAIYGASLPISQIYINMYNYIMYVIVKTQARVHCLICTYNAQVRMASA